MAPSFSGKRIIQDVIAAARIGVGIVAAKNITGRRGSSVIEDTATPKKPSAAELSNTAAINKGDLNRKKAP